MSRGSLEEKVARRLLTILVVVVISLVGYWNFNRVVTKQDLLGKWYHKHPVYVTESYTTFYEDGTYLTEDIAGVYTGRKTRGTWRLSFGKITFSFVNPGESGYVHTGTSTIWKKDNDIWLQGEGAPYQTIFKRVNTDIISSFNE